jgi:branched-chain amino acid transport system ATP-binding protein
VLDVGHVSLSGEAAELAKTDAVQRLYLGHAAGDEEQVHSAAARSTKTLSRWTA